MTRPAEKTAKVRDTEVLDATRHSTQLLVRAERLTHRLNVHLDEVQTLIDARKSHG